MKLGMVRCVALAAVGCLAIGAVQAQPAAELRARLQGRAAAANPAAPAANAPAANAPAAVAQPPAVGAVDPRGPDRTAILAATGKFAQALAGGDAAAVVALWTDEGEYAEGDAEPIRGKEALAQGYAEFFARVKDITAATSEESIRFVGKDTAIEEGIITVRPKNGAANVNRFRALFVRQDGAWKFAALKEWKDEATAAPQLKDLEWLIGSWEGDAGEVLAKTSYAWDEGHHFIKVTYKVSYKKDGKPIAGGTQLIGVDPAVGSIRSWTFDADGGIGEANWTWEGTRWAVESSGTLADGSDAEALSFLTPVDNDNFTWRSVQRTFGGQAQPDLPAIKVKRIAPAK